jgi:4-hydroxy-4-methyl-2-oxoglutarate aldolase
MAVQKTVSGKEIEDLSTPLIADAAMRLAVPLRVGPATLRAIEPGNRIAGRVTPVRHYGSGDILLEAIGHAAPGNVLVIDNGGRTDEACIGDLVVLEAKTSGLAGLITWGLHRDTAELVKIGFPVFSCGSFPAGPRRLDPAEANALQAARLGDFWVSGDDVAFGDIDGVLFIPQSHLEQVISLARKIAETERRQSDELRAGRTLREQLQFEQYLARRSSDPTYTFRVHLRHIGAAIEQ